jgi:hypothetical protein
MRRLVAAALAALSGVGVGVAHEAGAFAEHARPPAKPPHFSPGQPLHFPPGETPRFPLPPSVPPPPPAIPAAGRAVEHDAASNRDVKKVLCAAYETLYDPNNDSFQLPSLTSVAGKVLPATAAEQIQGILQTNQTRLQSLSDGDLDEVFASLACS